VERGGGAATPRDREYERGSMRDHDMERGAHRDRDFDSRRPPRDRDFDRRDNEIDRGARDRDYDRPPRDRDFDRGPHDPRDFNRRDHRDFHRPPLSRDRDIDRDHVWQRDRDVDRPAVRDRPGRDVDRSRDYSDYAARDSYDDRGRSDRGLRDGDRDHRYAEERGPPSCDEWRGRGNNNQCGLLTFSALDM